MTDLFSAPITAIDVPTDRARELDSAWAEALAAIIARQGLTNPITLRQNGERYSLVTGLHRLEAMRRNGAAHVTAILSTAATDDEARLEEVMENLGRAELTAFDRCHHLYELKQVYERMHPEAKHGGDRKSEEAIKTQSLRLDQDAQQIFGFAAATAEKVGLSKRAIELAVQIWMRLSSDSRRRLPGFDIARKQSELKQLSALMSKRQAQVLDLIEETDLPEVTTVAEAQEVLDHGRLTTDVEKKFLTFNASFRSLSQESFDRVLIANEERILESLKRRGRI